MMAEFALTPSIFDEAAHANPELWREQLRDLGYNMFPRVAAWPTMVSNLFGGSWHAVALQIATGIKDDRARRLCQAILENAAKTLVHRPAVLEWPEDELGWGREAIRSHTDEQIERIVACSGAHTTLHEELNLVRSIDEVQDGGFWSGISSDWSPAMRIAEQVQTLRKLCVHSDFMCLLTPNIFGGSDDETDFAIELARSALSRPPDYRPVSIEIHTEGPDRSDTPDFATRLANRTAGISQRLKEALKAGEKLDLIVWPKLLDRLVIAGLSVDGPAGNPQRSPRWGISMSHIARKPDEKQTGAITEWKLLNRESLGHWFDRFCKTGVTGFLCKSTIVS